MAASTGTDFLMSTRLLTNEERAAGVNRGALSIVSTTAPKPPSKGNDHGCIPARPMLRKRNPH